MTWKDATRVVRAGIPPAGSGEPFLPGPVFASAFHLPGSPEDAPYGYARHGHPTWTHLERALGELEGGDAVVFASGMAAVAAVLGVLLRPGDTAVVPADGYYRARELATGYFGELGVTARLVPSARAPRPDEVTGARLVWLETPSNPGLDVCDISAAVGLARQAGALVAVDNTTPTPLAQRPLELGADLSMASDTKALCGHADLLLGHVATADPELGARIRDWRTSTGAIPGPMEAWLAHRSLATLDVRLSRQCASAQALAVTLAAHPAVRSVRYPGLSDDPSHAIATRQMRRYGTLIAFDLGDRSRAEKFLDTCRLVTEATSFGGVHTSAERRARWGEDVPEGLVRLSVGCEDVEDLHADLTRALDHLRERSR